MDIYVPFTNITIGERDINTNHLFVTEYFVQSVRTTTYLV